MKTLIATVLTASALVAGAAQANTATLSSEASSYVSNIDAAALSYTDIQVINNAVHSGDDYNSVRAQILGVINN